MQKIKKAWIFFGIFLAVAIGLVVFLVSSYGNIIKAFWSPPQGNINVLILGKSGAGHEAPDLTDTVLFASVSEKKVAVISLSRDIWVPEIRAKLNSAYYWGGLSLAKSSIEKITGQPIHHALVIDFSGFKKMIDVLGGIEVEVKNSFTDEKYPIAGKEDDPCLECRYEIVSFVAGRQLMDGDTALKFVRSRNAEGDEGTDTARQARQQLVVSALKNKVLSPEVLFNPKKLAVLFEAAKNSIETDISSETGAILTRRFLEGRDSIKFYLIPEEFLENPSISPKYDRQYVFVPKSGDWSEVQKWVDTIR